MPVKRVLVSSLSGEPIPDGTGARIRIMFNDPDRVDMRADLTDAEAEKFAKSIKADEVEPRPDRRAGRALRRSA
jgi:hypothetical protein